jgi:NAD(P)-dependent dehydrogenase (short-subunit alcohol dehydrogenase family)
MKSVAIISGGSRGIGFAIAQQLIHDGFFVHIIGSNPENLKQAVAQLGIDNAQSSLCDMSSPAEVISLSQNLASLYPQLQILVNNVGAFLPGAMMDEPSGQWEKEWELNVSSAYHLTRGLWSNLKATSRSHVFNMCSIASIVSYSAGGTYAVTKHALLGFSKSLREEGRPHGIRVTSLLPGATLTDSWAGVDLPKERFMSAESVAKVLSVAYQINEDTLMEEVLLRPIQGDI